jgi:hypothetical protein
MTKFLTGWLCLLGFMAIRVESSGQDISNVRTFQENDKAVIVYDLLSTDPNREFYVKVYCSMDGGKTFGPMLTQVSGDANGIVKAGMNKMAIWDVLKESSMSKGDFVFRLDASSIGANGVLPKYDENQVTLQFIDIARTGNDVVLKALLTNRNPNLSQFIFANFLVVDDTDRICREFSGDVSKLVVVALNEKKMITFVVKNVNQAAKSFSQFDFSGSGLAVRLKNIPILSGSN